MSRLPDFSRFSNTSLQPQRIRRHHLIALVVLLLACAAVPVAAVAQSALSPGFSKNFGADVVAQNSTVPLFFSITNPNSDPNTSITLTGISFTDNLPAGLVVATPTQVTSDCGGTVTATAGSSTISLSGGALDPLPPLGPTPKGPTANAQGSCTISVMLLVTGTGFITNTTGPISTNESGVGGTATASVTVITALDVQKNFNVPSIPLGGTTTLLFTISDPANPDLSNGQISDTLPSGLAIASPPNASTTCTGGTVNATAGGSVVSLSGFSFPAGNGSSCQFQVDVTGVSAGTQNNVANALSMNFNNGSEVPGVVNSNQAQASVDVVAPPSIAKAFSPSTIALNATASLTFTITNPAGNDVAQNLVAFTDSLPTGLTIASATTPTCGGTLTTTAPTTIALSNASIGVGAQCQFSVTVTGAAAGQYTNTTGTVTAAFGDGGSISGNAASANLVVDAPPGITKTFAASTIPLNGTTTIDFLIANPNATALSGLAFTDSLPAGLTVASTPAPTNSCGGTLTATSGAAAIDLQNAALAAGASCNVVVAVQGTSAGIKLNSVTISSTEGGIGNTSNASLTVIPPPSISKTFGAASIPLNGSTSLTFTITNQDPQSALSGVAFTDTLPAGLVVATPNGQTGSCGAGTITATAGSGSVSLSGGTLAGGATCTFGVNVTGTAAGTKLNVSGNVTSTEGGSGNTASASLNVLGPPSIAKSFNPATIAVNGTTSLGFTITNPAANALALSGVAFSDTLPTGLTVANATTSQCGGTLTTTTPTSIALTGASIGVGGQCQFSIMVTGAVAGQYVNTTGNVTSTNGGTGNTASANLTVASVPTIGKTFGTTTIPLNGTTTLTFALVNPNATPLSGLGFTDSLPTGLTVAATPGASNNCGGALTAAAGSASIVLSGGNLSGSASCTVSVNVTGISAGVQNNTTGPITSNESGTGAPSNTATLTVVAPPTIAKAFGAASIPEFASTSLTFTIQNGNGVAVTGIAFSDTLPSGLVVSNPNGLNNSCGGAVSASAGSGTISLSGGSLAANSSCSILVNVTANAIGVMNNITGNITSVEGGTGGTASASLQVAALLPPTITKAFGAVSIAIRGTTALSFTITNPNPTSTLTGIGFTDALPSGLLVANPNGLTGACGGGTIGASAGATSVTLSGATLPGGGSCTFGVNVTTNQFGTFVNITGPVGSNETGPGAGSNAATLHAVTPSPTPALDQWALLLLAAAIALLGAPGLARRVTR